MGYGFYHFAVHPRTPPLIRGRPEKGIHCCRTTLTKKISCTWDEVGSPPLYLSFSSEGLIWALTVQMGECRHVTTWWASTSPFLDDFFSRTMMGGMRVLFVPPVEIKRLCALSFPILSTCTVSFLLTCFHRQCRVSFPLQFRISILFHDLPRWIFLFSCSSSVFTLNIVWLSFRLFICSE